MLHFDEEPTTRRSSRTSNRKFIPLDQLPDTGIWANPEDALIAEDEEREELNLLEAQKMLEMLPPQVAELLVYLTMSGEDFDWTLDDESMQVFQGQVGAARNNRQLMMEPPINDLVH